MRNFFLLSYSLIALGNVNQVSAAEGKLIGSAGLIQLEGSGGGGIVPWATLAGYDSRDQISINAVATRVDVDDYRLNMLGASISLYDRVELSIAKQKFEVPALNTDIEQYIYGAKYRIYGDVIYSEFPQISIGWQHKRLEDGSLASLLGAENSKSGNDFYLAATKVHLAALMGYNVVWNVSARATKANQIGLLGFGSKEHDNYKIMLEASAGVLLSRHLAVGFEYRQKPDNLGLGENDWKDFFVSYIPNKKINFTLAWAELGSIAGASDQSGLYLSFSGSFK
jgi:hypothetical protein